MSLNIAAQMTKMEIPMSVTRAFHAVHDIIGETDVCAKAAKLVRDLLSLEVSFTDDVIARVTSLAVIEAIVKVEGEIADEAVLYAQAVERAEKHMNAPQWRTIYAAKEISESNIVETTLIEDAGVSVALRADGKIKRGGKLVIAAALFDKYVLNSATPCDNKCFVEILMKEMGASKACSRTYAHNLRKASGMVA